MNDLTWIRLKLTQWGRKSRAVGIGYPTMSSHEKARIGRGGVFSGPSLPPDLEEIDAAVSRSPANHKLILVEIYTKDAHWRDHAARLRLTVDTYFARKKRAEVYLNTMLAAPNGQVLSRTG